ncbi:MAG: SLC13 family permease [Lentisphaerae bacterium]|nr:SLC13 family permease [Lentisphaerota bacterium]
MGIEAWITLAVLVGAVALLAGTRKAPDVILVGAAAALLVLGILDPREALRGLSNEGVVAIACLFCVGAGLRETGAMDWVTRHLLGRPKTVASAQMRIMLPTAAMSAFMNNTPLVAILLPVVHDWARKNRFPASKLLIPLSYASILGGACTLIGTSTNLVVNGWLLEAGYAGMGIFDIAPLGIPCALFGMGFLLVAGRWLLPDRQPPISQEDDPRSYTLEMTVDPDGPLVGKTIEAAGLRHLPGVYLMEVERAGETIPAVAPTERLQPDDRLVFVGVVESVVDLQRIRGLVPAADQLFKLDAPRGNRLLIEAVVSDSCPLVGHTIREGRFRTRYNAVVIAVARSGRRINRKIGDIALQSGDTLLLEAAPSFTTQQRNRRDFYLVSSVEGSAPLRHERAAVALCILTAMVVCVALGWLSMLKAAFVAAGLMLVTRCSTATAMRRAIDARTLLVIVAALALGRAMQSTGLAQAMSYPLVRMAGTQPYALAGALFALTAILAAVITSKAAVVLMLPLAAAAAADLSVSFMPFAVVIMLAAATTVATPIGYPTNLMVYGPGAYRFSDFLRVGVPVTIGVGCLATFLTPLMWPF